MSEQTLLESNDDDRMERVVSHHMDIIQEESFVDEEEQKVESNIESIQIPLRRKSSSSLTLENPFVCVQTLFLKAIILFMYFFINFFKFKLPWQILLSLILVVDFVFFNTYSQFKLIGTKWTIKRPQSSIIDIIQVQFNPNFLVTGDQSNNVYLDIVIFILSLLVHYLFALAHLLIVIFILEDYSQIYLDSIGISLNIINCIGFYLCFKAKKNIQRQNQVIQLRIISNSTKRTTIGQSLVSRNASIN
ncbi:transmembrane protein, putative (macronuclear) [Tetrahymena thermophila SB210]|uniref:Transmembrane protein, putative n=1 Tax=Tetrahymena thermophila (strain SB210) TaxID=312017 RepID=W7X6I3_TETTS|nr:transmembrane protein, putative [Tetrahymena thermophila SB210]EWS71968.1 transmembrane protein, putative [Tetrahymena thermophila SB210]|eukprot:XP_012655468.1 transmembrane protein, putative [Tetrahymena thermophila SB210]